VVGEHRHEVILTVDRFDLAAFLPTLVTSPGNSRG
jgi:hypothetical protein